MKKLIYIFLFLGVCLSCTESTSFTNANYNGKPPGSGYGKIVTSVFKANFDENLFESSKVRVFESDTFFDEDGIVIRGESDDEQIIFSFDGEIKTDTIYKLEDVSTNISVVYVADASLEESISHNFVSGEVEVLSYDLEKGEIELNYFGELENDVIVSEGFIEIKYIPDYFQAITPDGEEFIEDGVFVTNSKFQGLDILTIQASGNDKEGNSKNSISLIVGESIGANSYSLSLLSPNTGSYVTFDPLNSEIGTSGSIIIKNYDEEDSYISGTFSFKVPSGSVSGSFSQSF